MNTDLLSCIVSLAMLIVTFLYYLATKKILYTNQVAADCAKQARTDVILIQKQNLALALMERRIAALSCLQNCLYMVRYIQELNVEDEDFNAVLVQLLMQGMRSTSYRGDKTNNSGELASPQMELKDSKKFEYMTDDGEKLYKNMEIHRSYSLIMQIEMLFPNISCTWTRQFALKYSEILQAQSKNDLVVLFELCSGLEPIHTIETMWTVIKNEINVTFNS